MIADALRVEVERYAALMPYQSPLYARALEGRLTRTHITCYLTNMRAVIARSIPHLYRAAELAETRGDLALAEHLRQKASEEVGHEAWADHDIEAVSNRLHVIEPPLAATRSLIDFIESTIEEDPTLYLSYMLFVEYLIVLLGDGWLAVLEERCGIPTSSMTVVANHVEADRHHTEEALDRIDDLVDDPRKLDRMREIMLASIAHFQRFTCAVVDEADRAEDEIALQAAPAA